MIFRNLNSGLIVTGTYGTAYKLPDGTMIACVTKTEHNVTINTAWGGLYVSSTIAGIPYPEDFISAPTYTESVGWSGGGGSGGFDVSNFNGASKSKTGEFQVARPSASTDSEITITVIAVGRWK